MPLIEYEKHLFQKQARQLIDAANSIITEYQSEGYVLSLRQLYYQFVARGFIQNCQKQYDKLGKIISDARLAGLIDWAAIEDRSRSVNGNNHFKNPSHILSTVARQYKLDTRATQEIYLEVWVEKEALLGVIEPVCSELDVTYLACKGYYSQSAMWEAAQRILAAQESGKKAVVLHLGDHDPSGLDMTRDVLTRLTLFGAAVEVRRLALNIGQVEKYNPPPNFAKLTDTRANEYIAEYGSESWELDALNPKIIGELISCEVDRLTDQTKRQQLLPIQFGKKYFVPYPYI